MGPAHTASQYPCVELDPNWHGQPHAQLQLTNSGPRIIHSSATLSPLSKARGNQVPKRIVRASATSANGSERNIFGFHVASVRTRHQRSRMEQPQVVKSFGRNVEWV